MSEKNTLLLNLDTVLLVQYTCRTILSFREKFAKSILLSMLVKLRGLISDRNLGRNSFAYFFLLKECYIWLPNFSHSRELEHGDAKAYLLSSTENEANLRRYPSAGRLDSAATVQFQFVSNVGAELLEMLSDHFYLLKWSEIFYVKFTEVIYFPLLWSVLYIYIHIYIYSYFEIVSKNYFKILERILHFSLNYYLHSSQ